MNREEIVEFIKAQRLFFLATCDGGQARVRGMMMHKMTSNEIIFTTGKNKDVYNQLRANQQVEICFASDEAQVRITGKLIELDDDLELKKEILEARPFMKPWIDYAGFDVMGVFMLTKLIAVPWENTNPIGRKRSIKLFDE